MSEHPQSAPLENPAGGGSRTAFAVLLDLARTRRLELDLPTDEVDADGALVLAAYGGDADGPHLARRAFARVAQSARAAAADMGNEADLEPVVRAAAAGLPQRLTLAREQLAARLRRGDLEAELQRHQYDVRLRGSRPDDPGWHVCRCWTWEGYWFEWHAHVADHIEDLLTTFPPTWSPQPAAR